MKPEFSWIVFACLAWMSSTANAQTNVETDDVLLDSQGEYVQEAGDADSKLRIAVQVVATGKEQMVMQLFAGGLPGDGGRRIPTMKGQLSKGTVVGDRVEFTAGTKRGILQDGTLKLFDGEELFRELKRVERKSDTLGQQPPEGAIVLFDGQSADQFQSQNGKEAFVDGLLRQGIVSKESFGGDFKLHLEFKLPLEADRKGQARGNSGVYLQGRYEVQMLDSFGLKGEDNECGGIYGVKKPDVNMCLPPESWQTYDIDFQSAKWKDGRKVASARITVKHNGVLIHDDVEIPGPTTAAPLEESAEPGYLYFQDHGSPVRYRNIWLVQEE